MTFLRNTWKDEWQTATPVLYVPGFAFLQTSISAINLVVLKLYVRLALSPWVFLDN